MAPTEGRVARPGRRWGCRRGTPGYCLGVSQFTVRLLITCILAKEMRLWNRPFLQLSDLSDLPWPLIGSYGIPSHITVYIW